MPADLAARNKDTFSRLHAAMNSRDKEAVDHAVDEFFAPDVRIGTPAPTGTAGKQAMKDVWGRLLRAFPDLHVAVQDVIAEGDKVVCRNTVTGTHQGPYLGVAATGKSVSYEEIVIARFVDGRVAETWAVVDVLSVMRQIGAMPGRGGTA
ncbi:ester cyclase [Streptomyces venezuelae]|uniref:ester cyclase n=1 Tax=Streptomyces venezuelae TaxID=54571 RepID=UPI003439B2E0